MNGSSPAVFFDIGDTLARAHFGEDGRLERLDADPEVPGVLRDLQAHGLRLGIVSNKGNETAARVRELLEEAGIAMFFFSGPDPEPQLVVYGRKDSTAIFEQAATRAGFGDPERRQRCLFVGENAQERYFALQAGWRVAAGPQDVGAVLRGEQHGSSRIDGSADREDAKASILERGDS